MGRMRGEHEIPEGLIYQSEFITSEEEQAVLSFIEGITFEDVILHEQVARRKVKDYGYDYNFEERSVIPTEPIPKELDWLKERIALFAKIPSSKLVECLITKYPLNATMGWHRDALVFGPSIFGISLKSSCLMRFQRSESGKRYVYELELQPRSLYILSGAARYEWQHSIPATKDLRYSITFRTLKNK